MTTCVVCNRPLTDPDSIKRGIGPVCAAHQDHEQTAVDGQEFSDTYDGDTPFRQAFVMRRVLNENHYSSGTVETNIPHLVTHHSLNGFEFGYGGSGPADLALNVCQLYLTIVGYRGRTTKCLRGYCFTLAWMLHQDFKRDFIESVSQRGAIHPFDALDAWFQARMTPAVLARYVEEQELV